MGEKGQGDIVTTGTPGGLKSPAQYKGCLVQVREDLSQVGNLGIEARASPFLGDEKASREPKGSTRKVKV
jgi:hypothetical protein